MEPENNENCPYWTTKMDCDKCDHRWVAVHPVTGEDCGPLECPKCKHENWVAFRDPKPVHLIVSRMNGAVWLKPSRPVPVDILRAMTLDALEMLGKCEASVFHPEDSPLRAFLTVDTDQKFEDAEI